MNKTILIGFLLALTSISLHTTGEACPRVAGASAAEPFKVAPVKRNMQDGSNNAAPERNNYPAWWIVVAVLLLVSPLYLLFLLRQRQRMAGQLEVLSAQLKRLFDHAPCGYYAVDDRGYFLSMNNTLLKWLAYEKEEIVGRLMLADIVEGGKALVDEKAAAIMQGKPGKASLKLIKKNGEQLPVILEALPDDEAGPEGRKRFFSMIDNTECQEALDRIRNLDQELESFSYSISHDLRAPLRSIDGYSKILHEDYALTLGEEGRRVLQVVMNNAKRMGTLIDDLLEFARLGRKTMQRSHVNMTGMVESIMQGLIAQNQDRKIDVQLEALHPAFVDADMIRQVWLNLLDNAVKYSGKKDFTMIKIRSYKIGEAEVCYEVKDNGVGFDMKYAPKLFGIFQRLHRIQDFTGTGVGLAIVKRIISRHGGKVWAEGSLGNGALFYFTIPLEDENT